MKFARYLQDTQTPEWKKAYIDYRGLKKRIAAIRRWHEGLEPLSSSAEDTDTASTSTSRANTQHRSLHTVLSTLPPVHIRFFSFLDAQLEKIETFYSEREKEASARSKALEVQLKELKEHRKIYYEAHPNEQLSWSEIIISNLRSLPTTFTGGFHVPITLPPAASAHPESAAVRAIGKSDSRAPHRDSQATEVGVDLGEGSSNGKRKHPADFQESEVHRVNTVPQHTDVPDMSHGARLDPEEYQNARKKLKKAVLEHYRGLEVLNNYRVLNITGFRKALKKYEKVTKVSIQQAYIEERVETSAFFSGVSVAAMIKEMEELFAARFERGNKKRAMTRLRAGSQKTSHHFSTFRTGIALGLAVPAIASGVYQSFQPGRRAAIPSWDILYFIYAILLIPVLFGLMVGINVSVWSDARINYAFIFELDVRTRLDQHEYFEVPAILFSALAYAFCFSFSDVLSPTVWPLVWLVFTFVLLFNPLPVMFKASRWWLLRSVGDLLISGLHQVEFSDFWMGDQFCSLVFTLSNLYFIGCAYANGFESTVWHQCGLQTEAGVAGQFVLSMLPLLVRLVQSLRRYSDSKLVTHLINGGKYGAGILYYIFYYLWRFHGLESRGWSFVLWCLSGTVYAIYACTWDFLMDWSLLKPHSKYPLLRPELVYSTIPLYYFALISNALIRFIWVFLIPQRGPSIQLRTFIFAILEMLRRWQWNFYRLENEHLGNMDQYRVTREVPLPYSVDDTGGEEEEDGDEDAVSRRSWRREPSSTSLKTVIRHA